MIGQMHGTAGAGGNFTTLSAGDHTVGAAPVQKQNALFATLQIMRQFLLEYTTDGSMSATAKLFFHVSHKDFRQSLLIVTMRQRKAVVCSRLSKVTTFHRRRGRPHHQQSLILNAAVFRYLSCMIARYVL